MSAGRRNVDQNALGVELLFDFGSPNTHLAYKVIPSIEVRTRAKFAYVPVLLGRVFKARGNRSPIEAFASIPAKLAYKGKERDCFVARHGLAVPASSSATSAISATTSCQKSSARLSRRSADRAKGSLPGAYDSSLVRPASTCSRQVM